MNTNEALHIVSITRDEFDKAVAAATEKTAKEAAEKCGGMATFMIPMIGMIFAHELREQLFPEEAK